MDAAKKRRIKSALSWVLTLALVGSALGVSLLDRGGSPETGLSGSVKTATAFYGETQQSLRGGGKLSEQESVSMSLPEGVKLSSYLVTDGDYVSEGEIIATIDEVSLNAAVLEVEEALSSVLGKISQAQTSGENEKTLSPVAGRIKAIYAQVGEEAGTVMLRDGALLLLSLDGQIQVKLEAQTDLVPGDGVELRIDSAASEEEEPSPIMIQGRVETNLAGELVITAPDEGYPLEALAQVFREEGLIGEGLIEAHDAWRLMLTDGTVAKVRVKEEQTVAEGDPLFEWETLALVPAELLNQYDEYLQVLNELYALKEAGVVTASADGVISGLSEDYLAKASYPVKEDNPLSFALMGAGEENQTGSEGQQSSDSQEAPPESPSASDPAVDTLTSQLFAMLLSGEYTGYIGILTGSADGQIGALVQPEGIRLDQLTSLGSLSPDLSQMTQVLVFTAAVPVYQLSGAQMTLADPASLTAGTPVVIFTDAAGAVQMALTIPQTAASGDNSQTPGGDGFGGLDLSSLTPEQLAQLSSLIQSGAVPGLDLSGMISGGLNSLTPEQLAALAGYNTADLAALAGLDMSALYGLSMGDFMGGEAQEQLYRIAPWTLARIVPQEWMEITIPIDEQDLSLVKVGQRAEVQIEALGEEPVEGQVVKIATKGSNQGGSSKFDITIRLPRREGMLPGMSTSCRIPVSTTGTAGTDAGSDSQRLLIPIAALQEGESQFYVYTAYDQQKQLFLAPVPVTVGLSDENYVEILSGLQEGMTVYYSYLDSTPQE